MASAIPGVRGRGEGGGQNHFSFRKCLKSYFWCLRKKEKSHRQHFKVGLFLAFVTWFKKGQKKFTKKKKFFSVKNPNEVETKVYKTRIEAGPDFTNKFLRRASVVKNLSYGTAEHRKVSLLGWLKLANLCWSINFAHQGNPVRSFLP